jgi:hypothetical protein
MRDLERRRAAHDHRQQLIERVDLHKLDAGALEDLLTRHTPECLVKHPVGAPVAVVVRVGDQGAVAVEQGEVHAPGIQADAIQTRAIVAGR